MDRLARPSPCYRRGEPHEAHVRQIFEIDNDSPHGHKLLGLVLMQRHKVRDGLEPMIRALTANSNDVDVILWMILILAVTGQDDEATALAGKLSALDLAAIHGDAAQALALLDAKTLAVAWADFQFCSWVGEVYSLLGNREEAVRWLEHSIDRGYTIWRYFTRADWFLDHIRDDPRFLALMDRARRM
jgi:hypothetical protein